MHLLLVCDIFIFLKSLNWHESFSVGRIDFIISPPQALYEAYVKFHKAGNFEYFKIFLSHFILSPSHLTYLEGPKYLWILPFDEKLMLNNLKNFIPHVHIPFSLLYSLTTPDRPYNILSPTIQFTKYFSFFFLFFLTEIFRFRIIKWRRSGGR